MPGYQRRIVDDPLDVLLNELSAVSLDGPKGVGKTATAAQRAQRRLRLDLPRDRELLASGSQLIGSTPGTLLLDEWQLFPEVWDQVRRAVDDGAPPGSFVLTGSATPVARIHSGAGRIVPLRLRPMTLGERGVESPTVSLTALLAGHRSVGGETSVNLEQYLDEILRSGFPGIRSTRSDTSLRAQLDGYLERLVDHEVIESGGMHRRPATMMAWLRAYAASSGTSASFERVRDAATPGVSNKPTKVTANAYRDTLQRLWILDPLDAWLPGYNHLGRLNVAPKHYLADPALAARLLDLSADSLLGARSSAGEQPRDGAQLGQLFESLVVMCIRVFAQGAQARVAHMRNQNGRHEIDLIVSGEAGRVLAIEVKLTASPRDSDVGHLRWLKSEIGEDLIDAVVVTTGPYAYRRRDGIAVVPAALLGA